MKLSLPTLVLFFVACGLGIWAIKENRQRTSLQQEMVTLTKERDVLQITASRKLALEAKTDVRSDGPQGLGPDHAEALAEENKSKEKPAPAENNPMAAMAEMMKNPEMRDMMKSQIRSQIDFQYRDLFDMLSLDPEKQEKLTKLLAERAAAGMDMGFAMMGGEKLPEAEMKAKSEAVQAATKASEEAIKELLGDSAFSQFDTFEKSQVERQQLSTLNSQLKDKGLGLTEEAESQLMDAMFQERTAAKYDVDFADQRTVTPDKLTEENISRYQEQQAVVREKVLERAKTILNAEQLEVFRKSQDQQAAMEKMGMEMGLKMMGRSKEK